MNFAALIPILIKYLPLIIAFIQTQGPGIGKFIQEVEADILAAKNPDGSMNWAALLPLVFRYLPQIMTFLHSQGVPVQTVVADVVGALKGQPVASSALVPPSGHSMSGPATPVLSGPTFQFPPQPGFTS